ncbi:unnamed protein product, partial [marine sediment metagenome]
GRNDLNVQLAPLVAAKVYLIPNAAGDTTQIDDQYPDSGAHWDKVRTADDNRTRVEFDGPENGSKTRADLYNLTASGLGDVVINKITIFFRCAKGPWGGNYAYSYIKTGGSTYIGAEKRITLYDWTYLSRVWKTFSQEYSINPRTGRAWTVEELNALQAGVRLKTIGTGYGTTDIYCTHCGKCCQDEVCPVGEIFTRTTKPPCPALAKDRDGKFWCGLIVCPTTAMHAETKFAKHWAIVISKYLDDHIFNFGTGCERSEKNK